MCYVVACAANCAKCEANKGGKCDTDECASDYHLNGASNLCDGERFYDCLFGLGKLIVFNLVLYFGKRILLKGN